MKCILAQALWPDRPPEHVLTCVAFLETPASIWTGGKGGEIMRWTVEGGDLDGGRGSSALASNPAGEELFNNCHLSGDQDSSDTKERASTPDERPFSHGGSWAVRPVSLLYGHSAEVTFLEPCCSRSTSPTSSQRPAYTTYARLANTFASTNERAGSADGSSPGMEPAGGESLGSQKRIFDSVVSGGSEGVLCNWDGRTGRCRKRKRLPDWAGSPTEAKVLPHVPTLALIGCKARTGGSLGGVHAGNGWERSVATSLLIVDVATLSVVQSICRDCVGIDAIWAVGSGPKGGKADEGIDLGGCTAVASDSRGRLCMWKGSMAGGTQNLDLLTASELDSKGLETPGLQGERRGGWAPLDATQSRQVDDGYGPNQFDRGSIRSIRLSGDRQLVLVVLPHEWLLMSALTSAVLARGYCQMDESDWLDGGPSDADSKQTKTADLPQNGMTHGKDQSAASVGWPLLLAGCTFLEDTPGGRPALADGNYIPNPASEPSSQVRFLVWDERGGARVYSTPSDKIQAHQEESPGDRSHLPQLDVGLICTLPAVQGNSANGAIPSSKRTVLYRQMGACILRTACGPSILEEGLGANPVVEIWRVPGSELDETDSVGPNKGTVRHDVRPQLCHRIHLTDTWQEDSGEKAARHKQPNLEVGLDQNGENRLNGSRSLERESFTEWQEVATASCLISGGLVAPAVLVRGYATGEIRLLPLAPDSWHDQNASPTNPTSNPNPSPHSTPNPTPNPDPKSQYLLRLQGHKGPVLCLVEQIVTAGMRGGSSPAPRSPPGRSGVGSGRPPRGSSGTAPSSRVLISGGMDWTVRIWDLKRAATAGDVLLGGVRPLAVLHHHCGPVRQLSLPPAGTPAPWAACFLSVSDDGVVGLTSLETLKCERIMPGHPSEPRAVAWDGGQGFLACLCPAPSGRAAEEAEGEASVQRTAEGVDWTMQEEKVPGSGPGSGTGFAAGLGSESGTVQSKEQVDPGGNQDVLFLWDLQSGARDRVLVGRPALALFAHMASRALANGGVTPGIFTSVQLDPLEDSGPRGVGAVSGGEERGGEAGHGSGKGAASSSHAGNTTQGAAALATLNPAFPSAFASFSLSSSEGGGGVTDWTSVDALAPRGGAAPIARTGSGKGFPSAGSKDAGKGAVHGWSSGTRIQNPHQLQSAAIRGGSPLPGVGVLVFDPRSLFSLEQADESGASTSGARSPSGPSEQRGSERRAESEPVIARLNFEGGTQGVAGGKAETVGEEGSERRGGTGEASTSGQDREFRLSGLDGRSLRLALAFLHLWGLDPALDRRVTSDLRVRRPWGVGVGSALVGEKGALTLGLLGRPAQVELWRTSSEFCSTRGLALLALIQRLCHLDRSLRDTCQLLVEFYSRGLHEVLAAATAPSLEIYGCFWFDPNPHLRSAARYLFHASALRSYPSVLRNKLFSVLLDGRGGESASVALSPPTPDFSPPAPSLFSSSPRAQTPSSAHPSHDVPSSNPSPNPSPSPSPRSSRKELTRALSLSRMSPHARSGTKSSLAIDVPPQPDWGGWEPSEVGRWLEAADGQEWITWVGGTPQDARCVRVIVAAALAIWYPSLGRPDLGPAVAPPLLTLVRAANSQHSAAAAELLAEGMQTTWLPLIGPQIPRLVADVFTLSESLVLSRGGTSATGLGPTPRSPAGIATSVSTGTATGTDHRADPGPCPGTDEQAEYSSTGAMVEDALIGSLLPALATANMTAYLAAAQGQLAASSADSPVHRTALGALLKAIQDNPRAAVMHLNQMAAFLLQCMDPGNPALRKMCLQAAMAVVLELPQLFPMVALSLRHHARLAVGEALIDSAHLAVHVYDLKSVSKVRILDASGPPGHPGLMGSYHQRGGGVQIRSLGSLGGISAVAFSPDGESLVAFSQRGMTLRWWSLGANWWEKLSRGPTLIQSSKMVLVPPLPGVSSFPSLVGGFNGASPSQQGLDARGQTPVGDALLTLDVGFKLEWRPGGRIILYYNNVEVGSF